MPQPAAATLATPAAAPLRCCLLSGGASRRMGRDKALLPHPEGGTWLERQLHLLAGLGAPLTLLSGWPAHHEQAAGLLAPLAGRGVELELLTELALEPGVEPGPELPEPPEPRGPLVALGRLMEAHPQERLLLCPIDMPALTPECLRALLAAAWDTPEAIWIAAAQKPQPLLGVYPSDAGHRRSLRAALARGERSLLRWLAGELVRALPLPELALANLNTPAELHRWRAGFRSGPEGSTTGGSLDCSR